MPSLYGRKTYGEGNYSAGDVVSLDETHTARVSCVSSSALLFSTTTANTLRVSTITGAGRLSNASNTLLTALLCSCDEGAVFSSPSTSYIRSTSSALLSVLHDLVSSSNVRISHVDDGGAMFGVNASASLVSKALTTLEVVFTLEDTTLRTAIDTDAFISASFGVNGTMAGLLDLMSDNYAGAFWSAKDYTGSWNDASGDSNSWQDKPLTNNGWSPSIDQNWV